MMAKDISFIAGQTHDIEWLRKEHPEAFAALPGPYQNDSCLLFCYDLHGDLFAVPAPGQEEALGTCEWMFCPEENKWVR